MKNYFKQYVRSFDYMMLFCYILLCLFGLVMIYSASQMTAIRLNYEVDHFYTRQLQYLMLAWPMFLFVAIAPYKRWSNIRFLGFLTLVLIGLFAALFAMGTSVNGAKSWIRLGGISVQPSEYAKLFIIIYFAGVFYNKSKNKGYASIQDLKLNDLKAPISLWIAILIAVGFETDIGAMAILFVIAISMIVASGLKGAVLKRFLLNISFGGILAVIAVCILKWDSIVGSNRSNRITSFLDPFQYADGAGYQVVNGYYAIGLGGIQGLGLGQSIQKLGYLPEAHNDFILAIISEELGLFGVSVVLLCLGYIMLRGYWIAMNTKHVMERLLAAGVATWIAVQTCINVGGLTGLLPMTGVTLPFISYGGSSLLMLSLAVGILLNVSTMYKMEKRKS